jgi:hypothetical protein
MLLRCLRESCVGENENEQPKSFHEPQSSPELPRAQPGFLGSTRCQRFHLGSLPRCLGQLAKERRVLLPASCRQLQAGSLCSPDFRSVAVLNFKASMLGV